MPGEELIIALAADHRGVVAAETERRDEELRARLFCGGSKIGADAGVGRHAAGHGDLIIPQLLCRRHRARHERFAHRAAEGRRKPRAVERLAGLLAVVRQIDNGGLETGKAHVIGILADERVRQRVGVVAPLLRQPVDRRAAGIRQAEHTRGFIKALARGVVARPAENAKIGIAAHVHEHRVAAGNGKAEKRRFKLRVGNVVCGNVAADVVHRDERDAERRRGALGKVHAHEHRADEPRRVRHRHGVELGFFYARRRDRAVRQPRDDLHMAARSDLRHDAAVYGVQVGLREYLVGEHPPAVFGHGDGSLVARGFHG